MEVARSEAVDLRGFGSGEVVLLERFLNGEDAEVDTYSLKVSKVDGGWLRWVVK